MSVRQMGVGKGDSLGNDGESRGQTRDSETLGNVTNKTASGASDVPMSDVWGKETNVVRRDGAKGASETVGDLGTDRGSKAGTDAGSTR